jgi:hypothetical protein
MRRLVVGKVYKTTDAPWVNAKVLFRRTKSYTISTQYPSDAIEAFTNSEGFLRYREGDLVLDGVPLWCNEDGDLGSEYQCFLPNDRDGFRFVLPKGTSPIELSACIELGIVANNPTYPTLATYVDEQIDAAIAGVIAGENKKVVSEPAIAGANLSALRLVDMTSKQYASANNAGHLYAPIGFLLNSVAIGSEFSTVLFGTISDSSWNWSINSPVFLGNNGFLTQTLLPEFLFIRQAAIALSPTQLLINFEEPIKL